MERRPKNLSNEEILAAIPPFWKSNVKPWFEVAECIFTTLNYTLDLAKFSVVAMRLQPEIVEIVYDIVISNPPKEGKYEALKAALIERLCDLQENEESSDKQDEESSDKQNEADAPSQIISFLRDSSSNASGIPLQPFWIRHVSSDVRATLLCSPDEVLEKFALISDEIYEEFCFRAPCVQNSNKKRIYEDISVFTDGMREMLRVTPKDSFQIFHMLSILNTLQDKLCEEIVMLKKKLPAGSISKRKNLYEYFHFVKDLLNVVSNTCRSSGSAKYKINIQEKSRGMGWYTFK